MFPPDTGHLHLLFLLSWMFFPSLFTLPQLMSHFLRKIFHLSLTRLKHPMRSSHSAQCIPLPHSTGHSGDLVLIGSCDWCLSPSLNHTLYNIALLFLLITVIHILGRELMLNKYLSNIPRGCAREDKGGRWVSLEEEMSGCSNKLVILRALHHTFEKRPWELGIEVTFWWWKSRHGMRPPTGRTSWEERRQAYD